MKKFLLSLLVMVFSAPAFAGPHHHHRHHHGYHYYGHQHHAGRWIAPVIVGGIVGYALAQPSVTQPAPVIVQQQPVYIQENVNCTEWKEIMLPNGTIARERYCR